MKVITFLNEKGGVGKTTLASILGAGLALENYRVSLIDADGQADLTSALSLPPMPHFYDFAVRPHTPIFNREHPELSLIQRVPQDACPGDLYIVSGNYETYGIAGNHNTRDLSLALVKRLQAVSSVFDFVVIDTQPSPTPLHEAVLMMSDYVIVPSQAEHFSSKNLAMTLQHVEDARTRMQSYGRDKAQLLGIVPNMYRTTTNLHKMFLHDLKMKYGDLVYAPVPLRTAVAEAQAIQTFTLHDAPTLETNDYLWAFIDESMQRLGLEVAL